VALREELLRPDIAASPTPLEATLRRQPGALDAYVDPLPLVVEIWSPSTGEDDVDTNVPEFKARGHLQIWRLHPFERTLTAWMRQPDGTYAETVYRNGLVRPAALPGVVVDLDALFAT
jgi:Uma2 family endonuclease